MSNQSTDRKKNRHPGEPASYSIALFRIFGIEIRLDASVIIIFLLIVFSLGRGLFPQWHPQWSSLLSWSTALASGVLFFVSLLAHELSHSVVSQYYGIPVPRITLFLFGGMAQPSREPDSPKVEFLVAIAGPLMSLLVFIICLGLVMTMTDSAALLETIEQGEEAPFASLGPITTSLLWLGTINLIIAVFNMIPGFPMDGGRVFRAAIWGLTGNLVKATRWASYGGRFFGWFLMAMGVLSLFGEGGFGGIWWILIGWFISSLASMSYRQMLMDNHLRGYRIADLMRTRVEEVNATMELPDFVEQCLQRSSQQLWPVVENGRILGFVSLSDVADIPEHQRRGHSVRDVMKPWEESRHIKPATPVQEAFNRLVASGDEPIAVVHEGKMVGLIHHSDILKWLSLHEEGKQ